jgi:hypothetical protein
MAGGPLRVPDEIPMGRGIGVASGEARERCRGAKQRKLCGGGGPRPAASSADQCRPFERAASVQARGGQARPPLSLGSPLAALGDRGRTMVVGRRVASKHFTALGLGLQGGLGLVCSCCAWALQLQRRGRSTAVQSDESEVVHRLARVARTGSSVVGMYIIPPSRHVLLSSVFDSSTSHAGLRDDVRPGSHLCVSVGVSLSVETADVDIG